MNSTRLALIRKIFVLVCLASLGLSPLWAKKSYQVEAISVDVLVDRDGVLNVREQIRYRFKGSYSFAFRELTLKPGETLENVSVGEDGNAYTSMAGEKAPETFAVDRDGDRVKVTWFFSARDETRTFTLSYRMRGVVRRYPDTAELQFQFVGDGWDRPIADVGATVRFEQPVDAGDLKAWAHGPLYGDVAPPASEGVRFGVSPLPRRTFFEGRVLFPVSAVPGCANVSVEPALDRILAEEKRWAEEANRLRAEEAAARVWRRETAAQLLPWAILAALLGAAVWVFLFFLHGKPHPPQKSFPPGEPPGSLPPALASYLMRRDVGPPAIAATLIDLARRGFLKIEESEKEKSGWLGVKKFLDYRIELTGKSLSGAAEYERDLVEFAIGAAGDGRGVWMSDFKKTAAKSRTRFFKWFGRWRNKVKAVGKAQGFYEPYAVSALVANLACGLAILGFGVFCSVATRSPAGVPAIVAGGLQALLTAALNRRSPEGQDLYRGWRDFKTHLKSISRGLGPVSIQSENWGRYLVASIVLGLHRDLTKKMDLAQDPGLGHAMAWYVPHSSHSGQGLGDFGGGISSMVNSVGSVVSSAAGVGGGASAGGGAGSGGGGGGAG